MEVYRLTYGVELAGPIEGTKEELCAILDGYPDALVLEVLVFEKMARSEVYSVLLPYCARRMVEGFDGG